MSVRIVVAVCVRRVFSEGSEVQQTPRVADIFAQISCYVCQASSSGIHFGKEVYLLVVEHTVRVYCIRFTTGAITCEGCKVSENDAKDELILFEGFLSEEHQREGAKSVQMYG